MRRKSDAILYQHRYLNLCRGGGRAPGCILPDLYALHRWQLTLKVQCDDSVHMTLEHKYVGKDAECASAALKLKGACSPFLYEPLFEFGLRLRLSISRNRKGAIRHPHVSLVPPTDSLFLIVRGASNELPSNPWRRTTLAAPPSIATDAPSSRYARSEERRVGKE